MLSYSLVIFVMGPYEVLNRCKSSPNEWPAQAKTFLEALYQQEEVGNTTFVWRTWGYQDPGNNETAMKIVSNRAATYNNFFKAEIDKHSQERESLTNKSLSSVSYIDWAHVMSPRMFPSSKRIRGDMGPHYGLEARLTFLQMLMNHLVERDRQRELMQLGHFSATYVA
jgi:hypothetical protein